MITRIKDWLSGLSSNQKVAGIAAVAAVWSAVAAFFSAWATFGQVEATYHSGLYSKQVETISAFNQSFRDLMKDVETGTAPSDDHKKSFTLAYNALILVSPPQAARPINQLKEEIVGGFRSDTHKWGARETKRLELLLIQYMNCSQLQLATGHDLNGIKLVDCSAKHAAPYLSIKHETTDIKNPEL